MGFNQDVNGEKNIRGYSNWLKGISSLFKLGKGHSRIS